MNYCVLRSILLGAILSCCMPLYAQTPDKLFVEGGNAIQNVPTLEAPQNLIRNGDFTAPVADSWIFSAKTPVVSLVDVAGQSFQRALHLEIATEVEHPWDARMVTPKINQPLAKDSLIAVRFWARSPQKAQIGVRFQRSQTPFDKIISHNMVLSPEWSEYRFFTQLGSSLAPEATQFEFHLGYGVGAIELANVRVENFGVGLVKDLEAKLGAQSLDYWGGQPSNDLWKTAAFERIEQYRKGDIKICVADATGKPISNANIKLVQTRQLFRWGSAVNAARLIDTTDPNNLRYQAEVKRLFNTVVFENDLKWSNDNPNKTGQALEAANWLRANAIEIRGHNLVWGARKFLPKIVADNWDDTEQVRQLVRDRVRKAAQMWKGRVYVWDVVNEAATNAELWDKLGWDEFANVFKIAHEVDPNVKLAYNDYNIANEAQSPLSNARQRARVLQIVQLLRDKGAPLDILGDQAHFGTPLTHPGRVVEIWAEMAKLGMPIEITEYDAAIPDDQLHADYTRDILIAAFAEPKIESFLMWGFWQGAHWRANEGGAMFRTDWTKRPAQEAYENLVLKQWMTHVQLTTDKDGVIQTRGFLGEYDVVIQAEGREKTLHISLGKAGLEQQILF
ncbi:anti-sigma-I factor RsgI6 [Abditibacteriota bacterium]|nr:anti-sigma-I factor RsgI6 [Abditibacteriota bacterium]